MTQVVKWREELPQYTGSTPSFSEFDPRYIPWQMNVINDMEKADYTKGVHEFMLSGAVGSAKSILMAHQIVKHCVYYPRARLAIARKAMPDLKDTLFRKIFDHLGDDFTDGEDIRLIENRGMIKFKNGSEIISRSWADRKSFKVRSLELSSAAIEEVTENDDIDKRAVEELIMRTGRLPHVPESWVMVATNPDSPSHWAYKRWIDTKDPLRHVYYSITTDNPFLPKAYVNKLLGDLDPKMAARMVYGRWLDIQGETIYHQYDSNVHELLWQYKIDESQPIHFSWDFNIGAGKPLSVIFYQIIDGVFHFFDEVVIEGARTESNLEEAANKGLFELSSEYICHGDATGTRRDTRSNLSDYEIIDNFMRRYTQKNGTTLRYKREIPTVNPPIRTRHNVMNRYLKNALGEVKIFVYPKCKVFREGMKLTKLRRGAEYQEDDSKFYQHITTAAGYGVCWHDMIINRKKSGARES